MWAHKRFPHPWFNLQDDITCGTRGFKQVNFEKSTTFLYNAICIELIKHTQNR